MPMTLSARRAALLLAPLSAALFAGSARAQYEPPKQMTLSPTGVSLSDGRYSYETVDLSVGPFTLKRSYLGGHTIDGSDLFGPNWTHNHSIYVVEKDRSKADGIYIVMGRETVHFTYSGFGNPACLNPDCEGATLEVVGGNFVYTDKYANVYTFDQSVNAFPPPGNLSPPLRNQRVARIDYADGHTLIYSYNSSKQLKQVASNEGYSLVFDYDSSGYISKACGYNRAVTYLAAASCTGAALAVGYSHDSLGNLVTVVDALNQNWGYSYGSGTNAAQLTCVKQVNSSSCLVANTFATGGRPREVSQQILADGSVWNYYYSFPDPEDPQLPGEPPALSTGNYTGPEGIEVGADFGGGLLDYYTENGRTTHLEWDGIELRRLSHPEGNAITYGRDYRQNVVTETWTPKPGSGAPTVSRTTFYPDPQTSYCPTVGRIKCNKPLWREDYNGNRTTYDYYDHGGIKTETGPLVGGIHPQVRYEYVPRRAWVLTGPSAYGQEAGQIYLVSRRAFCRTSEPLNRGCTADNDEVVTTYDYGPDSGPNNLTLKSETTTADGVSRKTCYSYDWQGNRISTTHPNGLCQ